MLKNNYFLAREIFVLLVTTILVFGVTALLGIFGTNYVIQNAPFFGNVVFEDFRSSLLFCTKLAIILVYVIRPFFYMVSWAIIRRKEKR
jgi:hypothetical protein